MLKQHKQMFSAVAVLSLLTTSQAIAPFSFSPFINVNKTNEAEHDIKIDISILKNQQYVFQIKLPVLGGEGPDKECWLIICKSPLKAEQQEFRGHIWKQAIELSFPKDSGPYAFIHKVFEDQDLAIRSDIMLNIPAIPNKEGIIQFTLHRDVIPRSYVYIDFPWPFLGNGHYFSIDLASYVKEPKEPKK